MTFEEWRDRTRHISREESTIDYEGVAWDASLREARLELLDTDLPPAHRIEANYWKMRFFEMSEEVRHANKGIRRLKKILSKRKFG